MTPRWRHRKGEDDLAVNVQPSGPDVDRNRELARAPAGGDEVILGSVWVADTDDLQAPTNILHPEYKTSAGGVRKCRDARVRTRRNAGRGWIGLEVVPFETPKPGVQVSRIKPRHSLCLCTSYPLPAGRLVKRTPRWILAVVNPRPPCGRGGRLRGGSGAPEAEDDADGLEDDQQVKID